MQRHSGSWRAAAVVLALALAGCGPVPVRLQSPDVEPGGIVTFRYHAPAARIVQVAGSWDGNSFLAGREWTRDTRAGRMEDPDRDGTWELRVPLGPGRYEYVFLVDGGLWEADPWNPERVPDGAGGQRSLLIVP